MFDLQGHRGARGLFPENTLEGFRATAALGVRCVELDVGVTRDGVLVVHHDVRLNPDLARTPQGRWVEGTPPLLRELTFAELAAYDVGRIRPGSGYAALYATQAPMDGARIPTLEQVLCLDPALRFNIELKLLPDRPDWTVAPEEMVERVLRVVDGADAAARVTLQSFDWRAPRHVRRLRPDIARGWLTEVRTIAAAPLWRGDAAAPTTLDAVPGCIEAEGGGTWTCHHPDLTPALLAQSHGLGLKVIPWTVNAPGDLSRLTGWGVDGVISDWPNRALAGQLG